MLKQEMIPDGTGTVGLSGFESLVDEYLLKHDYLKFEESKFEDLKQALRGVALAAIRAARKAGAQRAFLRSSKRGGALVTLPDYSKPANRPKFNDEKLSELMKLGGLEVLGLKPEEVFEEERTEGGEVIELHGRWIEWFKSHYAERLQAGNDPDLKWEKREPKIIRRVKEAVLPQLEAAAAAGSAVAQLLVSKGFQALTVRAEEK